MRTPPHGIFMVVLNAQDRILMEPGAQGPTTAMASRVSLPSGCPFSVCWRGLARPLSG